MRVCTTDGCDKPHMGRGLCANHYKQWQYRQNPEKYRNWSRLQRLREPERLRANDRARHAADPTKARVASTVRKGRVRGAEGSFTAKEWKALLARFNGRCAYCGAAATSRDHMVPISKGGSNTIENILPACLTCNLRKHDSYPLQFVARMLDERFPNELPHARLFPPEPIRL